MKTKRLFLQLTKKMFQNKKGQELSTNTIVLLILAVLVLVFLILGFTVGWGKIAPFIKPGNNAKEIAQSCSVACSTNAIYDICSVGRELKTEDGNLLEVTCNYLSKKQTKYGIETCQEISCADFVFIDLQLGENLIDSCEGNEGKTIQALVGDTLESEDCILN